MFKGHCFPKAIILKEMGVCMQGLPTKSQSQ